MLLGKHDECARWTKKVIDELDIRFKTISDWIYFVSYKKGYKPYQLDEDEVALLIETYENLYMVVEAVRQRELNPENRTGRRNRSPL